MRESTTLDIVLYSGVGLLFANNVLVRWQAAASNRIVMGILTGLNVSAAGYFFVVGVPGLSDKYKMISYIFGFLFLMHTAVNVARRADMTRHEVYRATAPTDAERQARLEAALKAMEEDEARAAGSAGTDSPDQDPPPAVH